MQRAPLIACLIGLLGCAEVDPACGSSSGDLPHVDPGADPCRDLSSYRFFAGFGADGRTIWNEGVIPYDLNTPLFSDYTLKERAIYIPPGSGPVAWPTSAEDTIDEAPDFPVGTVLIKTFALAEDLRDPASPIDRIETRLLTRTEEGWRANVYLWNEERTDAFHEPIGQRGLHLEWTHHDGSTRSTSEYLVPTEQNCRTCHRGGDGIRLLGPRAPQLIGREAMGALVDAGWLASPPTDTVTAFPSWEQDGRPSEPVSAMDGETLDRYARSYLDSNCASCHNPFGNTQGAGLDFRFHIDEARVLGVCKVPFAAGSEGQGGRTYDIVPGDPEDSVMIFRLESSHVEIDHPNRRMPPIGRSIPHDEGVELMRAWVEWLATEEAEARYPELADRPCGL